MFLDFSDQGADLSRHGMLRRLLQKNIEGLNTLLMVAHACECLSENQLRGAGSAPAYGDRDLRLVARFVVALLAKVGVGEQVVRQPIASIGDDCLLQRGS